VDSDFKIVDSPVPQQIGVQINAPVSHSPIAGIVDSRNVTVQQAIEQADIAELAQIASAYLDEIVDLIKSDLKGKELVAYTLAVQELKDALTQQEPEHNTLQRLVRTIAFLDNANGAIELGAKGWDLAATVLPYVPVLIDVIRRMSASP
jgi:hypothetical protein